MPGSPSNLDRAEIAHFNAISAQWWNRKGVLKALHDINPVRVEYIARRTRLAERDLVDVGCGGGLLAEALARHGARVTGIDMAAEALAVARNHARGNRLTIDYRWTTAEVLAAAAPASFDVVTCLELLEHVPQPAALVRSCARLARPGADLFFATVNRTVLSRLLVIWASELIFGIVRKGTHHYRKLVRPVELDLWGRQAGLRLSDLSGVRYLPFLGWTGLSRDTSMNYLVHFKRDYHAGP